MTDDERFERIASDWMSVGPAQAPDHVIQAVLRALPSTHQERGRRAPLWRFQRMSGFIRAAAIAAAAMSVISVPIIVNGGRPSAPRPALPPTACPSGSPLASGTIATVAGTFGAGSPQPLTAGTAAIGAHVGVNAVAVAPGGTLVLSDGITPAVWQVGSDGSLQTFVDTSTAPQLQMPNGIAFDADGNLFIADTMGSRVWRRTPSGEVTLVAGTGVGGTDGNEGPALSATLENPSTIAVGPDGSVYFDDHNNFRRVDPQGTIHAFAGSLTPGYTGDGGPATAATLGESVLGAAADGRGNIYLGDESNHVVRKVDPKGVITTVAGTGTLGYSGDGGQATETDLEEPVGLAVDSDGSIYLVDNQSGTVQRIDPSGVITTVAGTGAIRALGGPGSAEAAGDCGPATLATLDLPSALAVRDGVLYIVDGSNTRVRMVVP